MLPSYSRGDAVDASREARLLRQASGCGGAREEIFAAWTERARPECLIEREALSDKGEPKKARRAYSARIHPLPPTLPDLYFHRPKNKPNRETLRRALRRAALRCSQLERKPFSGGGRRPGADRSAGEPDGTMPCRSRRR
ncbi:hypothetical protein MTO96_012652 [Rhipicephalus appendiculatus]